MFVHDLKIENLKLLKDVRLQFAEKGVPRPWTVLIGENGTGKTTVLRALAMAAAGATRSSQFVDVASLPDRRSQSAKVRIRSTFETGGPLDGRQGTFSPARYRTVAGTLELRAGSQKISGSSHWVGERKTKVDVIDEAQTATESAWFVLGYGVHRELGALSAPERRSQLVVDRLAPLFEPSAPILGPGFAEQMLDADMSRAFARTLSKVLIQSGLLPGFSGIELVGRGTVRDASGLEGHRFSQRIGDELLTLPTRWLSQGYQATIVWVADLVGQAMLHAGRPLESEDIEGLVLIDELDLYLHPAWQRQLIPTLRSTFPHVQFVATTHSPLVLTGLEPGEAHLVSMADSGDVSVRRLDENPQLRTGSELYSDFFGVAGLSPTPAAGGYVATVLWRTTLSALMLRTRNFVSSGRR